MTNRKSHTRFRLVPKSMTFDNLEGPLCTLFQNTCIFRRPPPKCGPSRSSKVIDALFLSGSWASCLLKLQVREIDDHFTKDSVVFIVVANASQLRMWICSHVLHSGLIILFAGVPWRLQRDVAKMHRTHNIPRISLQMAFIHKKASASGGLRDPLPGPCP